MNKILNLFYGTYLGGLYFDFLLWLDRKSNKKAIKYLTPKEMATIVKESNKIHTGVAIIKQKVNSLVNSKSREEYHEILCEIEDLTTLSHRNNTSEVAKFSKMLRDTYVKKGNKDITTHTEMAKMIDQRIEDIKELWEHQAKRQLLRDIRKAGAASDTQLLNKLQLEYKSKYGRSKRN
jgi:pyruvate/2-oxoglutarate/acetoin dehydrogenase E1 component